MQTIWFNAHHSPIGAFATFTLGFPGAKGGLGLELGGPPNQEIYIGAESERPNDFEALPFFSVSNWDEAARYDVGAAAAGQGPRVRPFARDAVRREFGVCSDTWLAGDLRFTIYSPMRSLPEPGKVPSDALREALVPAVLAELTLDNTGGSRPRKAFFGFKGTDAYSGMRRIDDTTNGRLKGVGQGRHVAVVTTDRACSSAQGFSIEKVVAPEVEANLAFGLGWVGALTMTVPAGRKATARFAVCFHRGGIATAGMSARYYYTRMFPDIESVGLFAMQRFARLKAAALAADRKLARSRLSDDQRFMLAHAIRSYYGSTELLERDGAPVWVVNEGEYRMMNTFDLTVDHLFFEMRMNPWVVRNVLDLFVDRYAYRDKVRFPKEERLHPGGISFTHDMGIANVFSRPGYSSYELFRLDGCFSHMTHEQLVNWVCCACVYLARTNDRAWLKRRQGILADCLRSMENRDHPDLAFRTGIMKLDSSRVEGGAEITTYDSLDVSLGQARNNVYLAVKCWAAYVCLERLFAGMKRTDLAADCADQAHRCAATLVRRMRPEGYIPAVIDENNDSRIIPAIEGLVFPAVCGYSDLVSETGPYGELVRMLKRHLTTVLAKGTCLFDDGAWKMSSTSDNSWLSKIYLSQFVARGVLGMPWDDAGKAADAAHAAWLLRDENAYFAWSDQMVKGVARGSKYYPRGVTAILWLDE
jgi:hypothetical protein